MRIAAETLQEEACRSVSLLKDKAMKGVCQAFSDAVGDFSDALRTEYMLFPLAFWGKDDYILANKRELEKRSHSARGKEHPHDL